MDGMDERRSSPQDPFRNGRALEGDWAAGLPGPAHVHGLPAPEPLGLPPEAEAAPEPAAVATPEPSAEPAVEAPADWGAAAEPPPEAPAETTAAEAEEEFPVTLSEADEIQEETTAPIDVAPFAESGLEVESIEVDAGGEPLDAEAALAQMEAAPSDVEAPPADVEAAPADAEAVPSDGEAAPAQEAAATDVEAAPAESEAAPPEVEAIPSEMEPAQAEPTAPPDTEAAEIDIPVDIEPIPSEAGAEAAPSSSGEAETPSSDWLAHPDAAAPADNWEQATFGSESTTDMEAAFAAVEAPPGSPGLESEVPAPLPAEDAWGEPTAAPASASPDVEPWAVPVDSPWGGSSPVPATPEIARPSESGELTEEPPEPDWARERRQMQPPPPGAELTEEPPEPDWSQERRPVIAPPGGELTEEPPLPEWAQGPREVFTPLPKGATLTDDETPPELAGGDRGTPPQLELVRGPETLEDAEDLLVPVDDPTPPRGVAPVESAQILVVPGEQRVAIHTRAGRTRRGTVTDLDLSQPSIPLEPQGGGATENIEHADVKAIFFMLAPGEKAEHPGGQAVRVTFADGRSIEGHRQGEDSSQGFFLVPLDAQRTNTRRIYVARDAISELVEI
jgi:hypothetical protein